MDNEMGLVLKNITGISIGDSLINANTLEEDKVLWLGRALLPGIGKEHFNVSDENLLRMLCFEYMPFVLTADHSLVLRAEVTRFPYSINGNKSYQAFSCRLVPETGTITQIKIHSNCLVALGSQIFSPESVIMDIGNESLHLELFFESKESNQLGPLQPPAGFAEDYVFDPKDTID